MTGNDDALYAGLNSAQRKAAKEENNSNGYLKTDKTAPLSMGDKNVKSIDNTTNSGNDNQNTLPQTGDKKENVALLLGASLITTSLAVLGISSRKKAILIGNYPLRRCGTVAKKLNNTTYN